MLQARNLACHTCSPHFTRSAGPVWLHKSFLNTVFPHLSLGFSKNLIPTGSFSITTKNPYLLHTPHVHTTRLICLYYLKFIVVILSLPSIIILNSKIGSYFLLTNFQKSTYLYQRTFRLLVYDRRLCAFGCNLHIAR